MLAPVKKSAFRADVPIHYVQGDLDIEKTNLITLTNAPFHVANNVTILGNKKLKSLDGLPGKIGRKLRIGNNRNLDSLRGIEHTSDIQSIIMGYYPHMPLLRLLVAKKSVDVDHADLNEILNYHIQKYSSFKERMYKCQYALIKAGFKDNAKW